MSATGIKKENDFRLVFNMYKSFGSNAGAMSKDLGISDEVPSFFEGTDFGQGVFAYGVATTERVDSEGEIVKIDDSIFEGLTEAPYNKVFLSHDNADIAAGKIVFAGRVPEIENKFVIVERLNEAHPNFGNFVGSIENGSLDSFSVGGSAEFDPTTKTRKVTSLREVSMTSCPANPDAEINGLFFIKTAEGGYEYFKKTGETKMKTDEINKMLDDKLGNLSENIAKVMDDKLTAFKKDLDAEAKEKADVEAKAKEDAEAKAKEDAPAEPAVPEEDAKETEESKEDGIAKAMKAPLEDKKSIKKSEKKSDFRKDLKNKGNDAFMAVMKGDKKSLFGGM